jgi:hypothetical protein
MELHTEDRFVFHPQTFDGMIVQAFVSDFHFIFVQVAFGNAVVMILRGDEHFPARQVLDRMVPTMMTELEFMSIGSQR